MILELSIEHLIQFSIKLSKSIKVNIASKHAACLLLRQPDSSPHPFLTRWSFFLQFFSNPHHSSSLPGRHEFLNSPPSPSMLKGNSPPDSPSILRGDCRPNRPPPPRHLRGLHRLSVAVQELPLWRRKENHGDSPPIRGDQGRPNRLQRLSIAVQVQNKHSTISI